MAKRKFNDGDFVLFREARRWADRACIVLGYVDKSCYRVLDIYTKSVYGVSTRRLSILTEEQVISLLERTSARRYDRINRYGVTKLYENSRERAVTLQHIQQAKQQARSFNHAS